jgi:hypothetical protein
MTQSTTAKGATGATVGAGAHASAAHTGPPAARRLYLSPPAPDEREQELLEREFFSALRLRNGTYKYTYARRLDDVNERVLPLLPSGRPLEVMDVAVSSGISTLEWSQQLTRAGVEHRVVAGDLTVNGFIVSRGRHLHVLVDGAGYPLQYEVWGRVLPASPGRRLRALYFAPLSLIGRTLAAQFERLRAECVQSPEGLAGAEGGVACRRVELVSPRLRRPANMEVVEDDIVNDNWRGRPFHVLRAANVLNRSYFDEPTLTRALDNLRSRLVPGGLLVVCRTDSAGANHGTVFRLQPDGTFGTVARVGGGSEVEELALALGPVGAAGARGTARG